MTDLPAGTPEVTVRYWAAAREAAGCTSERLSGSSLAEVITSAAQRHGPALARLLDICSFIVGDLPVKRSDAAAVALSADAVVEVLPPFAGGSALTCARA